MVEGQDQGFEVLVRLDLEDWVQGSNSWRMVGLRHDL